MKHLKSIPDTYFDIKTIVFDIGGVCVQNPASALMVNSASAWGISVDQIEQGVSALEHPFTETQFEKFSPESFNDSVSDGNSEFNNSQSIEFQQSYLKHFHGYERGYFSAAEFYHKILIMGF